ncbi:RecX family transcriptional regulator [Candidatus Saccharibacteria bacterium]|nr:RecX family transcriptional regulator [Candidatus Saccharibacteria bacterium]
MKITEMKQGVKNPERVNVFVDGKFAFSLDISQVVDFGIKIGDELSEAELNELKNASAFGKLYQRTLEWALTRPRSVRETRDYLIRKLKMSFEGYPQSLRGHSDEPREDGREERPEKDMLELSSEIIGRLLSKGYLDDRKFAAYYVENRFVKKGISKKRLRLELVKKGISGEIIDEVLNKRNDEEEIKKMIAKKRAKYDDEKLINYLCRQGFSFELAQSLVRETD